MKPPFARLLCLGAAVVLTACASTKIPREPVAATSPEALALLTAAQRAHGAAVFSTVRDLNVKYAGKWGAIGPRFQPVLADQKFRRESEEALDLVAGTSVQLHTGPGGRKFVFRSPGRVAVWYNGQPDERPEIKSAAALVADAYKMFLLGPLYFQRSGVTLTTLGTGKVDGAECDQLLAVLRPGFGFADEDRVVLSIDRQTQRLRRVLMTLNGLTSTQGAEVDVTFRDWAQRGGVWWATVYTERIRAPFHLLAHHWKLIDLKANHGFAPRQPEMMGEAASQAWQQ